MVKITLVAGCWAANIGNAFLDLGSMELLKQACPSAEIKITSSFPIWLFDSKSSSRWNMFKSSNSNHFSLIGQLDCDYVVFSGMVLSEGFIKRYRDEIIDLKEKGVEVIINGGGCRTYDDVEVKKYSEFLKDIQPYCFISRDKASFESFKDLTKHSYDGIDCAFFLSECFRPAPLTLGEFDVHNFDNIADPVETKKDVRIIRTHHSITNLRKDYFSEADTLISDQPADYLNLYGNTREVHSDRVHACVATLSFGNRCRLYSDTLRARLFEKVGIGIPEIREAVVSLDKNRLMKAKQEQVQFLSSVLDEKITS